MTSVVLAPGWSLWVEGRLLVEGEPLDHLDDEAQEEMVRRGRAVRVGALDEGRERGVSGGRLHRGRRFLASIFARDRALSNSERDELKPSATSGGRRDRS